MSYCQKKCCQWALSSLIVKLKHKASTAQCPHSLVKNVILHLNGVPDSTASPTVNANRNDERLLGEERRLGLVTSPGPRDRRPNWFQAEAGYSLVTRQPLSDLCSVFPVCANGSCHHHCVWASSRRVTFIHPDLRETVKGRQPTVEKRTVPLLLR